MRPAAGNIGQAPCDQPEDRDQMEEAQLRRGSGHWPASRACRRSRTAVRTSGSSKALPIGYFHIDIAELRTAEGQFYLFVAIDRTSKFAFVALHETTYRPTAVRFLEALIVAAAYRLHTVLTDNGIQFGDLPRDRNGWTAQYRGHRFDQICRANNIEHRLTKPNHPWTNGQVERMNRTINEATVKCTTCRTRSCARAGWRTRITSSSAVN